MQKLKTLVLSVIAMVVCTFQLAAQKVPESARVPDSAYSFIENVGTVVRYNYEYKNPYRDDGKTYKKSALVYLPYGYDINDTKKEYNVLYLMHGGAQSPEWFFSGEYAGSLPKTILDHLINDGQIEPLVVCAVTYFNGYSSNDFANCKNFHRLLKEQIMPGFEEKYHIKKDRNHRAFGGFSMGGFTTWSVFENALEDFSLFLPISGNSLMLSGNANGAGGEATARFLADRVKGQNKTKKDFKIYSGTGFHDIAYPNLTPQIEAMKNYPDVFVYDDELKDGNFCCLVCPNSGHDLTTVLSCMYYGLPRLFGTAGR